MLHCLGRSYPRFTELSLYFFVSFPLRIFFLHLTVVIVSFFRFTHPHSGKALEFSCPPPEDFTEVLDELRRVTLTSDGQDSDGVAQLSD